MIFKPRAILFDLDGTLVDTAPDFVVAVNEVCREFSLTTIPENLICEQVSNGALAVATLIKEYCTAKQTAELLRDKLLLAYSNIIGQYAALYPSLEELLNSLHKNQIYWGIVTNKPRAYTEPLLKALELDSHCNALVCPDDVALAKPDPEGLLLACNTLNIEPHSAIYIGDHKRDIDSGKAAGMKTIAATYGYINAGDQPNEWGADHELNTSTDLAKHIISLISP